MQIEDLCSYGKKLLVRRGDPIYESPDPGNAVYVLEHGICALESISRDGNEYIYLYFHEKRLIGFAPAMMRMMHMHSSQTRQFVITAKTDCIIYSIPADTFDSLMKDSDFSQLMIRVLFENYMELMNHYNINEEESAAVRLCRLLLEQSSEKQNGKRELNPYFTYAEIARYLGVHSVTIARMMSSLKDIGAIEKNGHITAISNSSILEEIIQGKRTVKY